MGSEDERPVGSPVTKDDGVSPGKEDTREKRKDVSRDRSRSRDKSTRRDKERYRKSRSRSKDRKRRLRSRSRDRRKRDGPRSRSRSRRSRSRSRDRRERRRGSRSRSRSRGRHSRQSRPSRSRSPRKQPPAGGAPGSDPFAALRTAAPAPGMADPAIVQRLWQEQQMRARTMVLQQQQVSQQSAATKSQREIHVGNLVPGAVTDAMLMQIFNTALGVRFPSSIPGMEPVQKVQIHKDGRYGFIELRTAEMATAAMDLSGQIQFMGNSMTINRPSAYVPPERMAAPMVQIPGVGIMGLPGVASSAPSMMPNMALPMPPAGVPLPGPPSGGPPPGVPPPQVPPGAPPPGIPGQSMAPTPSVCVVGMVGAEDLVRDADYAEVQADLKSECEKLAGVGSVLQVKVPRPPQPEMAMQLINTGYYGHAYVYFSTAQAAMMAQAGIHGRTFAGKPLQVVFITPEHYASIV